MSAILFKISSSMRDFYSILPCTIAQNVVPVGNLSLHTRNVNPHSMNFFGANLQLFPRSPLHFWCGQFVIHRQKEFLQEIAVVHVVNQQHLFGPLVRQFKRRVGHLLPR